MTTEQTGAAIRALGLSRYELIKAFNTEYGKGAYHAEALFRRLFGSGTADVSAMEEFAPAADLARRVEQDYHLVLPSVGRIQNDGGTRKFTLRLAGGDLSESVLIPMSGWETLCLSSQIGCRRGCVFCETGQMGLIRNLDAAEIVAQWAVSRFSLGSSPRNLVYMGMGEPFDNFDQVIRSVRILSDSKGAGIPKKRISISTSGHVPGIRALSALEAEHPEEAWRTVHLAVSLNGPNDRIRDRLMPVNRQWNMGELKAALMEAPQSSIKDALYLEYVVIPGVNDRAADAGELARWMEGLNAKLNIIPYHPRMDSPWNAPDQATMDRFHEVIRREGIECRTRRSRGRGIEAACGMLGGKGLTSGAPEGTETPA